MFWVRKKLMTYQEIEPRPLAALQAFCQLQSRVAATHSLQLWREEGRERAEDQYMATYKEIWALPYKVVALCSFKSIIIWISDVFGCALLCL